MQSKALQFILKLAVSSVLVVWLVFKIDWNEVLVIVAGAKFFYIFLYVIILLLGIWISSYKWKILANFKGIKLSSWEAFRLYIAGIFVNNFMPSFIGGDTFKAYKIGKPEKKYHEAATTVVVDRITGLVGAMILTIVFALFNLESVLQYEVLVFINAIVLAILVATLFFLEKSEWFLKGWFSRFIPGKLKKFADELHEYNNKSGILSVAMLWSFLFSMVGLAAVNYMIFLALGIEIGIMDYLSVIFLISIVSSIPVSINNIGIKEWAYITFFGFFGVGSSAVVTIALLSRFLQMLVSFTALPAYLKERNRSDVSN